MKNITNYLAVGVIALGITGVAQAVPTLKLTTGANVITISDGGAGDTLALSGAINFNGSIGDWFINVSTGLSKPVLGSPSSPHMDLNSINTSNAQGSTTITLMFSDTDFTQLGTGVAAWGGTAGGTIKYDTYWSATNSLFAMDNLMTSESFGTGAFSGTTTGGPTGVSPYSLTQVVTITHAAGVKNSSFDAELRVSDSGSTIALLGAALATLGLISRRRKIAA